MRPDYAAMYERKLAMALCPWCHADDGLLDDGAFSIGADTHGIFMRHDPCGHKGRPADGDRLDAGIPLTHDGCEHTVPEGANGANGIRHSGDSVSRN